MSKYIQAKEIKKGDIVILSIIGDIEVAHVVVGNKVIITPKND